MSEDEDEEFGVDELAQRAGTTVRNVRLYQERGLLPKPERRGRSAYYRSTHLTRLQLILRLMARGYSLAAIKDLTEAWDTRRGLGQILGLEQVLAHPFTEETPVPVSRQDVIDAFPGDWSDEVREGWFRRSIDLGLLAPDGDGYLMPSPRFFAAGAELAANGFPVDAVFDAAETIVRDTRDLASMFVGLFMEHIWEPFEVAGKPEDQIPELIDTVNRLRPLAGQTVAAALGLAIQNLVDETILTEKDLLPPNP
ncbi:MAG: transcriptional regulator, MerR family [Actinomycetia bacterium]|nr:transcriptional regulator, MerR family [Actinomycetes bacterium]